ncbi:TPA: hypothetical protein N0F65_009251 [Lagenidium giganteum]|uniref:UDP-glucose 6-dehydrogenase n=1 Tax=Lagenidium giganteum TaxID=4803 RepID=A0AAV2YI89_9STRA|nr:TPA: hypothetical protein N0F65_009251 [Lagenidium giganteum]
MTAPTKASGAGAGAGAGAALTICCIGAGHVGGATSAVIAKHCPTVKVLVVDKCAAKIAQWQTGSDLPVYEPGLAPIVKAQLGTNLFFSTDVKQAVAAASMVFVCVDTPTKSSGLGAGSASDTCNYEVVARAIAQASTSDKIIVEKSTVPVRTADAISEVLRANATSPDVHFDVISNPEFMAEGSAVADVESPNRILIGGAETPRAKDAVDKLIWLYTHWVPREKIFTTNVWSSELAKLVANAFLAQRVSSINSVSAICEATGANVHEVAHAVGTDDRIGSQFLNASIGFGGSALHQDVLNLVYLARTLKLPQVAEYWHHVIAINDYQKRRFVRNMVKVMFNTLVGKKICLYGFAYKKNTSHARESAAASIIKALLIERAVITVYDPLVKEDEMNAELVRQGVDLEAAKSRLTFSADPYAAAADAHAVAVLTAWDDVKKLDFERVYAKMAKPACFFDGRNLLPHAKLRALGAEVHAIGQAFAG